MDWIPNDPGDLIAVLDAALTDLDAEPLQLAVLEILEVLSGDAPGGEAEAACRLFARTGRVPRGLPDRTRWQVSCRVRAARECCHCLSGVGRDGRTAGDTLERLLTEYWDDTGRWNWIQEDLLAGDDFSGNGPQPPE